MKHKNLMIFVFLSLVFLSPIFVTGQEDPVGEDTWHEFPLFADYDEYIELAWGNEGDLIYWHIEVDGDVRFYFVNSSKDWEDPIFSKMIEAGDKHEYNITLPYDNTFYFLIVELASSSVGIDGWYARDETPPEGEMWGINTNFADEILIGSTRDISCVFSDWFDIVNIVLYENDVMARTFTGPVDTMVEWTVSDYEFTTLGMIEMSFKCEDRGRNVKTISKIIKVVNKLSLPPTTSKPEYFDWIGIFEDYWYVMIPVGVVLGVALMLGLEKAGVLH